MSGFLGCGTLYFDRLVDGSSTGWVKVGNAMKFAIKSNSTLKERKSKSCDSYGQTIDSVSVPEPSELSVTLDDLQRENLAIAFLGNDFQNDITAGTVTDEPVTAPALGSIFQTALGQISGLVITDLGGVTTYVAGTDYKIDNAAVGLVQILVGGAITQGESLLVDYSNGGFTSGKVTGGTESQIKTAIKLVGTNLVNETGVEVDVWRATLAPNSEIDFLSDDYTTIDLQGRIELDEVRGNGFEVITEIVKV